MSGNMLMNADGMQMMCAGLGVLGLHGHPMEHMFSSMDPAAASLAWAAGHRLGVHRSLTSAPLSPDTTCSTPILADGVHKRRRSASASAAARAAAAAAAHPDSTDDPHRHDVDDDSSGGSSDLEVFNTSQSSADLTKDDELLIGGGSDTDDMDDDLEDEHHQGNHIRFIVHLFKWGKKRK